MSKLASPSNNPSSDHGITVLEDQRSFFSHLNVWKKTLRESKKKSKVDIRQVEGWEKEWIDSKTNESNLMQGRNTRADVVCDESRD